MPEISIPIEEVRNYCTNGWFIVPTWDRDIPEKNKKHKAPTRAGYKNLRLTSEQIINIMLDDDTTAFAAVLGEPSGGIISIDIDSKFLPGFDATYLSAIKEMFPHLYEKLRIHKTPSGGYHLLMRVNGIVKSQKVAGRPATEQELAKSPKDEVKYFLEVKGEGSLTQLPPSPGYQHISGQISDFTVEEYQSLLSLGKSFDQLPPKVEKVYLPKKASTEYSTNPWDDYELKTDPVELLKGYGWHLISAEGQFIRFAKPGQKKEVSGVFNRKIQRYWFWTGFSLTDTNVTISKLKCIMDFNGDFKRMYEWLVQEGYGERSYHAEKRIIKTLATKQDAPIPKNLSSKALEEVKAIREEVKKNHPHGTFWEVNDKGKWVINLHSIQEVMKGMGFRIAKSNGNMCHIVGYTIRTVERNDIFAAVKAYMPSDSVELYDAYEHTVKNSGSHIIGQLMYLEEDRIMASEKRKAYKFFRNCYTETTPDNCTIHEYSELPEGKLIWDNAIIKRDFYFMVPEKMRNSVPYEYFDKIVSNGFKNPLLWPIIGYYAHDFKDNTYVYAAILTEESDLGAGTGKSTFCRLMGLYTSFLEVPADQVTTDSKLLQSWKGERVMCLSDAGKEVLMNLTKMKAILDGDVIVKKLFKDERSVAARHIPKFILTSNYMPVLSDQGLDRRIIILETTPFFKLQGGIDTYFGGKMFPTQDSSGDWTVDDYLAFDNIMHTGLQAMLKRGKLSNIELSANGWEKQFKAQHGAYLFDFIADNIEDFKRRKHIGLDVFKEIYDKYCHANDINIRQKRTVPKVIEAITEYCKREGVMYKSREIVNGVVCHSFGDSPIVSNDELPF